jgi:hypothetical protein
MDMKRYTKSEPVFEDDDWWYYSPSGYRQRVSTHAAKNKNRMYVNGRYIPSSHPLHKPGRYKALDDVWSHTEIEKTSEGEVYLIMNPAWPEWVKVGKAAIATDRLSNYQTSSPFRDYIIIKSVKTKDRHATETDLLIRFEAESVERRGEWFKISKEKASELLAL